MAMAQAFATNKGPLVPGQTIAVNNHTVQVERYLSHGGFAYVYLVRTPTPVYNTTHHVLKRIAVANEAMLTEVKKEVDIMRLLKGHPNIVHLIDAAWHKLSNGQFEVFILMEFCPGGGIIDMMNRRLRERLTEAEILTIFVDVLEGVAHMHNSRPPLLHRDLKVENILQSSPTSFKLCDFGSATTISPPATTMTEIRALEAELNRHTTLQYRAPEMIDLYNKRHINEKADIWALGVLLYKLCYYTTPFEEHGPLAILNVQYRIPPYPVYSQSMNALIASMLREHGSQRPTAFELLDHVHRLRGTKSKYSYPLPTAQPLSPRVPQPISSPNPLGGVVTYTNPSARNTQPTAYDVKPLQGASVANQGINARDKVLDAITPLRRGRPSIPKDSQSSRPSSPQRITPRPSVPEKSRETSETSFHAEQDRAWRAALDKVTGPTKQASTDAWDISTPGPDRRAANASSGFGDDFGQKLWSASDANQMATQAIPSKPRHSEGTSRVHPPIRSMAYTGVGGRAADAFEGLGLITNSSRPAPTLGEARKLRTGLATMSSSFPEGDYRSSDKSPVQRPTPSPRAKYLSVQPLNTRSTSPSANPSNFSNFRPSPSPKASHSPLPDVTPEARFPSLEELDAKFAPSPPSSSLYPSSVGQAAPKYIGTTTLPLKFDERNTRPLDIKSQGHSRGTTSSGTDIGPTRTSRFNHSSATNGIRSTHVTGTAFRETKSRFGDDLASSTSTSATTSSKFSSATRQDTSSTGAATSQGNDDDQLWKPSMLRQPRSSMAMKAVSASLSDIGSETPRSSTEHLAPPKLPARPSRKTHDWLTGDDDDNGREDEIVERFELANEQAVLRNSPSKRASLIEHSGMAIHSGASAQHLFMPEPSSVEPEYQSESPTVANFKKSFPALESIDTKKAQKAGSGLTDNWSPIPTHKEPEPQDSSSEEEEDGPEDASSSQRRQDTRHKPRQSSVHNLVNQYGGGLQLKEKEKERTHAPQRAPVEYPAHRPYGSLAVPAKASADRESPTSSRFSSGVSAASTRTQYVEPPSSDRSPIPSPINKSPSSGRNRPQSMFHFPARVSPTEPAAPAASLLSPPVPSQEERRPGRRTSISDMVQRYEAIGSVAPKPTRPPSPNLATKPTHSKAFALAQEAERSNPALSKTTKPAWSVGSMQTGSSYEQPSVARERPYAAEPQRTPVKQQPTRKATLERASSPQPEQHTPRPRRISQRVADSATAIAAAARSSPVKTTVPLPASLAHAEEVKDRDPSPEQPYQGVGRLIDQWQKKSVESTRGGGGSPAKRFATKG